jgi:hypothetical protein
MVKTVGDSAEFWPAGLLLWFRLQCPFAWLLHRAQWRSHPIGFRLHCLLPGCYTLRSEPALATEALNAQLFSVFVCEHLST